MISPEKLQEDSMEVNRMFLEIENGEVGFTEGHIQEIAQGPLSFTRKQEAPVETARNLFEGRGSAATRLVEDTHSRQVFE